MNIQKQHNISDIHIIGKNTREWIITQQRKSHSLSITLAGISHAEYEFHFKRHNPSMTHIITCWEGKGLVLIDGKLEECAAGQAYITPTAQPHEYMAINGSPWKITWMHVNCVDKSFEPSQPTLKTTDCDALHEIISGMHRENISNCDSSVLDNWYAILYQQCMRLLGGGNLDIRLRQLWHIVDASPEQEWTLAKMADIANLSEEHLRRLCIAQYGVSPMKRLRSMRMQRAAILLQSSNSKIEYIASIVGYKNPLAFSTAFHREMKCTPSAFRKISQ